MNIKVNFCVRPSPLISFCLSQNGLLTSLHIACVSYHNCTDKPVTCHGMVQHYCQYYMLVISFLEIFMWLNVTIPNGAATVSLISKICYVRIFGYKYVAISYKILDNQVRPCTCLIHHIQIRSGDLSLNDWRFVETFLCKYKLFFSAKIVDPLNRNTQIFQKPWNQLQILGVKRMAWCNSLTGIPQFWSNIFSSVLFDDLFSVRLSWYVFLYWYIYAEKISRRPYEIYSARRRGAQDLYTYLLTYSMEQIPSWEANWFCS
jgi:hypothetical protein